MRHTVKGMISLAVQPLSIANINIFYQQPRLHHSVCKNYDLLTDLDTMCDNSSLQHLHYFVLMNIVTLTGNV